MHRGEAKAASPPMKTHIIGSPASILHDMLVKYRARKRTEEAARRAKVRRKNVGMGLIGRIESTRSQTWSYFGFIYVHREGGG